MKEAYLIRKININTSPSIGSQREGTKRASFLKKHPAKTPFSWLLSEGLRGLVCSIALQNGRYSRGKRVNNLWIKLIFGCARRSEFLCISEGYYKNLSLNFKGTCPFCIVSMATNWGDILSSINANLAYQVCFFLYISCLKSRRKLPPGKEKNGLRLAARRCDTEWVFSQIIDACRAFFCS